MNKTITTVCIAVFSFMSQSYGDSEATHVEIVQDSKGNYELLRNGEPYTIRGAGGPSRYKELAAAGGNSTRTWGTRQLREVDEDGKSLLDHAHDAGVSVIAGVWVQQVRHGFDYSDSESLQKQREHIRKAVREFRDHPAILMWGLGNEIVITTMGDDPAVWRELNELAKIVKEEDPSRPVMSVIAGTRDTKVKGILKHAPEIDVLGVNAYGGGAGVPARLREFGWTKPFILSEFGPKGHWEVSKTEWGAPLEPTAEKKAELYLKTYNDIKSASDGNYLGSYAFLWGNRQEVTPTWFSMFLETGQKTPAVDFMSYAWTGEWPQDRAPLIKSWSVPFAKQEVEPNETFTVKAKASDDKGWGLEYKWWVLPEKKGPSVGGDTEKWLTPVEGVIISSVGESAKIRMPEEPGAYRLYLKVDDRSGGASTRNTPFYVK